MFFKTQCYFLSAFCETFHTPYTAAVQASDEFVKKDGTVRMVGGYRMRLMLRLYASLICVAENLLESHKTIGNDMKENYSWARYKKLHNTLEDSFRKKIDEQNEFTLKNVVVVTGRHTFETLTSNIWCMRGDVFPFNKIGAELVNAAVAPLDERACIVTQMDKNFSDQMEVMKQQFRNLPRVRLPKKFLKVLTSRIRTSLAVPNGYISHIRRNKEEGFTNSYARCEYVKKRLQLREDCVDDFIVLRGKYDIEYDQEVQVVSNEDSEALLDNEEIGDKEMGIALEDNEGNGDERIVNE
jgi:dihydrofolate reductase